MTPLTLVILAAGMGSRYAGPKLADPVGPKLADPVGPSGEHVIDYSLYDASRAGFSRFVFVVRREMEDSFKERVCNRLGKRLAIEFVDQEIARLPTGYHPPQGRLKPWGTTHAVLIAEKAVREPFAVINVDDYYASESYHALARHLQSGTGEHAMVGFVLRNTLWDFGPVARAMCKVGSGGYLESIVELKNIEPENGHARSIDSAGRTARLTGDEIVSMNMWGFTPQIFTPLRERFIEFLEMSGNDLQAECVLPSTINELLQAGQLKVKVLRSEESWFGVTYREDHIRAVVNLRRMIESGYYPRHLWG